MGEHHALGVARRPGGVDQAAALVDGHVAEAGVLYTRGKTGVA